MSVLATHLLSGPKHDFGKAPQQCITLLKGIGVKGDVHSGKEDQHEYHRKIDSRVGKIRDNLRQVHLIESELYDGEEFHGLDGERVEPGQLGENITTISIDLLALGKDAKLHFVDEMDEWTVDTPKEKRREQMRLQSARHFNRLLGGSIALAFLTIFIVGSGYVLWWFPVTILLTLTAFLGYTLVVFPSTKGPAAVVRLTGLRVPCKRIDEFRKGLKVKCQLPNEKGMVGMKGGVMGVVEEGGVVKPGMKILVEKAAVWEKLPKV